MTDVLFLDSGGDYFRRYVKEMRTLPRVGEYVDFGDNVRRYVTEVEHQVDPANVSVLCFLEVGYAPAERQRAMNKAKGL